MPYKGKRSLANDKVAKDIVEIDIRQKVLNGILAAKSDKAIAEETGLTKSEIKRLKFEIRNVMTKNYHDTVEHVKTIAYSRLERLARTTFAMALGDKPISLTGMPDINWAKLALALTKAQVEITQSDLERQQEANKNSEHFNYTQVENLTLIANDEMFRYANEKLWQEWQVTGNDDYRQGYLNAIVSNDPDDEPDFATISQQLKRIETTYTDGIPPDDTPDEDET
jgi:hypothetical protein